ncbi:hypothetical protein [Stenotrophomonas maltophilia]|uniref:hypothetical protein n=1 Tax=Stenotrophomonas maltophilia TaxID=40324 RepID=UPI001FA7B44A|nr:hypothetical protein [Stenotrophomonas maltophilia]
MNAWNPTAVRMFIPALVGWCLALATSLRAEQLHGDPHAQALLPVLQQGAVALLVLSLACTVAACVLLWRHGRGDGGRLASGTTPVPRPSAGPGTVRAGTR